MLRVTTRISLVVLILGEMIPPGASVLDYIRQIEIGRPINRQAQNYLRMRQ